MKWMKYVQYIILWLWMNRYYLCVNNHQIDGQFLLSEDELNMKKNGTFCGEVIGPISYTWPDRAASWQPGSSTWRWGRWTHPPWSRSVRVGCTNSRWIFRRSPGSSSPAFRSPTPEITQNNKLHWLSGEVFIYSLSWLRKGENSFIALTTSNYAKCDTYYVFTCFSVRYWYIRLLCNKENCKNL